MRILPAPRCRVGVANLACRSGVKRSRVWNPLIVARVAITAALVGTVVCHAGAASAVIVAQSGSGTMTVNTNSVGAGATTSLVFTFTASAGTFSNNSQVSLTVPAGWTAPTAAAQSAGYTTATSGTCNPGNVSISGMTITVVQSCNAGRSFTINYSSASAPTQAGPSTFAATSTAAGGTAKALASSPTVTVNPGAAVKLGFVQGPGDAFAGFAMSPAVTVQVQDTYGNATTANSVAVTLTPSSGIIDSGSTATTDSSGLATFSAVTINSTVTGATIAASATGYTATAASATFNVTVKVTSALNALSDTAADPNGANGSGVASVSYYYCAGLTGSCTASNGTLIGISTTAAGGFATSWNNQPGNGAYRIAAVAQDNAGNPSTPSAATPVTVVN